ncbi:MAG: hypothetical protein DRI92_06425 [Aquificota bacterium]|nr:MAG: hypothetical protein DRI92_06425 [Aquificota bacterium]
MKLTIIHATGIILATGHTAHHLQLAYGGDISHRMNGLYHQHLTSHSHSSMHLTSGHIIMDIMLDIGKEIM